jgi:hypothetical protein
MGQATPEVDNSLDRNSFLEPRGNSTATVFVYDDKVNYIADKN